MIKAAQASAATVTRKLRQNIFSSFDTRRSAVDRGRYNVMRQQIVKFEMVV
jgi:hypothetical protein